MAEAIVAQLLDHLTSMVVERLLQEVSLVTSFREEFEFICDELDSIKCLLNDASGGGRARINSNSMRNWLQKLQDFLYDAVHILEACKFQVRSGFIFRYRMGRKIRVLKERIKNIHRSAKYLKYLKSIDVKPHAKLFNGDSEEKRRKSSGLLMEATTVGMQNDIDLIVRWVLVDGYHILAVVGMGGLGKTLLLQHVFNSQNVREYFDHLIWVAVSQNFVAHQLLLHIARQINLADDKKQADLSAEELRVNIHKHLQGSRSLLVLDDVWDKHALRWVGFPMDDRNKIVITARDKKVLEHMGAHQTHHMDYLSDENSWKLFCIHAFPDCEDHNPPKELENVARAIERKCSRLPLAVKTIAASMAGVKRLPNEWESTLSRLNKIDTMKDDVLPILRLSYDALPAYLKLCFLSCSAFPQDTRMGCEYLIKLWIAEGFVCVEETEDPYDVGHSYLNQLIDRCMLEFVPYDGNDHIIKYCKMHDLLHDLALSESENETRSLYEAGKNLKEFPVDKCQGRRRISMIKNEISAIKKPIRSPGLRTLLLWNNIPLESICKHFFSKVNHLSVLDLSQTSIKSLPESIENLVQLRFLNLSRTNIEKLPRFLSALPSLLFLDVSFCKYLKTLHVGVDKHQRMVHLNIEGCQNLEFAPSGISKLVFLRILKQVEFKSKASATKALQMIDLKGLTLLRHLSIVLSESTGISEGIFGGMAEMRKLFFQNAGDIVLRLPDDMALMRRLEILHLHNCMVPTWISHLKNLMVLLLKGDDSADYQALETIPNLRRLILLQNKRCIDFPTDFGKPMAFPKLEKLIIEDFYCLKTFPPLEENAMSMLKYFRLANCRKMEGTPQGLERLNSLEELQVVGCPGCEKDLMENRDCWQILKDRRVKLKFQ